MASCALPPGDPRLLFILVIQRYVQRQEHRDIISERGGEEERHCDRARPRRPLSAPARGRDGDGPHQRQVMFSTCEMYPD